ncbi:amidohydrolase family protein [Streptomyces sp. NPDC048523]|uniref:amidohydrolase family protein n=1 Tax=Streptomyces sp. NPDC048523 TaxID=3365567 RepID=UPI0037163D8E
MAHATGTTVGNGAGTGPLALTHVTVIDGSGAAPAPDMTVVAEGGRITALTPSARARLRPGTRTVDLTGKFLIPGLIEAHTHSDDPQTVVPVAGLTPAEALRAATRDAARTLALPGVGTVARGQAADLLVLDADPLRDIRNTRRIHGVVVDGRWITPEERRRLPTAVEKAAAQTPPPEEGATMTGCGCGGHP